MSDSGQQPQLDDVQARLRAFLNDEALPFVSNKPTVNDAAPTTATEAQQPQLNEKHIRDLAASGIPPEVAIRNGLFSADAAQVQRLLGRSRSVGAGLVIPYSDPNTGGTLQVEWQHGDDKRQADFVRVRLDEPSLAADKKGKPAKYLSRAKAGHPKYAVLSLTGRIRCSDPNALQTPRKGGFRECFIALAGFFLLSIDYAFIELVMLAAICLHRYGTSKLAEIIAAGIDPHCYTAALLMKLPLDDFMKLKDSEPDRFKDLRQKAKAVNFGVPGGMRGEALVAYAWTNYKTRLTLQEAEAFHKRLVSEIYPELSSYLQSQTVELLAERLGCSTDELWAELDPQANCRDWLPIVIPRVLKGEQKKRGGAYSENVVDRNGRGAQEGRRPNHHSRLHQMR
jgi:hypothetical protein